MPSPKQACKSARDAEFGRGGWSQPGRDGAFCQEGLRERNGKPSSAGLWETVPVIGSLRELSGLGISLASGNQGPCVAAARARAKQGIDVRRADSGDAGRPGPRLEGPHGREFFAAPRGERERCVMVVKSVPAGIGAACCCLLDLVDLCCWRAGSRCIWGRSRPASAQHRSGTAWIRQGPWRTRSALWKPGAAQQVARVIGSLHGRPRFGFHSGAHRITPPFSRTVGASACCFGHGPGPCLRSEGSPAAESSIRPSSRPGASAAGRRYRPAQPTRRYSLRLGEHR